MSTNPHYLGANDAASAVDAASVCALEQIQFLGEVQQHGFVLELSSDWLVRRASTNIGQFIRIDGDLLGSAATDVLGRQAVHDLRSQLQVSDASGGVEVVIGAAIAGADRPFDLRIHRLADSLIVEGEISVAPSEAIQSNVQKMLVQLQRLGSVDAVTKTAVRQIRALSGYDRVMCYRFHEDDSGEVIAESRRSGIEPFLGLRYPATDIPQQARLLYLRNTIRMISDVDSPTFSVEPRIDVHGQRLDLSLADLRAVSPTHIQYLKNMGVSASMSLSIVVDGKLWGLLACHHYSDRVLPTATRQTLAFYANVVSSTIESAKREELLQRQSNARAMHLRMLSRVSSESASMDDLFPHMVDLVDTFDADGVAMYVDGRLKLDGLTLPPHQMLDLTRFLNGAAASQVYQTHQLRTVLPFPLESDDVAGLLAIPVSRRPRDFVMFFRRELVAAVRWAGLPEKAVVTQPDGALRLSPRSSFDEWRQIVRGESAHFSASDMALAESLRVSLLEIMLQVTDAAEKQRRVTNDQQDLLISELNHRVRNILGLIIGLVRQCADGATDIASFSEEVNSRVHALARAHDQLTSDGWGARSISQMIEIEAGAYLGPKAERVIVTGDDAAIQPNAFATVALVVHELITNAAKYGAFRDSHGIVRIQLDCDDKLGLSLHWKEEGGATVTQPTRRGFGSTIIERAIPHELGGRAEIIYEPDGLRARLLIPSDYVSRCDRTPPPEIMQRDSALGNSSGRLQGEVLLVEDNLLIALETEAMLLSIGADGVQVCSSVSSALDYLASHRPTFAILDYNLGKEQSTSVAARLADLNISFVFATGYGDSSMIDPQFRDRPILTKPYSAANVLGGFERAARPTGQLSAGHDKSQIEGAAN